ncbi:MAG: cation transporter [Sciscionella sp.]|nr:cation transporter [Sciscionella sp.]
MHEYEHDSIAHESAADDSVAHQRESGSRWHRLWHAVSHAVSHALGGHSHESADRVDTALERSDVGMRALVLSFVGLFATAAAQFALALITGSVAVLGDTVHNAADALTALPIGIAFALGRRAPNRRYTYGFGRAEDVAGGVVVLVIAASALFAGYESVLRLVHPRGVTHLWVVAVAGVIGFAGNEIVARYRITVGRRIASAALVADGLHARADGFTSLAVVVGAAGVALGFPLADPIVGLAIMVAIAFVLRDAAREVFHRMLDAVDPAAVDAAEHAARTVDGVLDVDRLRMRWVGHRLYADLAVTVDDALAVRQAHRIAHHVEEALAVAVPRLAEAVVRVQPSIPAADARR